MKNKPLRAAQGQSCFSHRKKSLSQSLDWSVSNTRILIKSLWVKLEY